MPMHMSLAHKLVLWCSSHLIMCSIVRLIISTLTLVRLMPVHSGIADGMSVHFAFSYGMCIRIGIANAWLYCKGRATSY